MPSKYKQIRDLEPADVEEILHLGGPRELAYVPISLGLNATDPVWGQNVCISLATHADRTVRGNALLGLGHIARVHRWLDPTRAHALIEGGLRDESEYVRGQADCAADDVKMFLGWTVQRPAAEHSAAPDGGPNDTSDL